MLILLTTAIITFVIKILLKIKRNKKIEYKINSI